ncbi:hypothetical protein FLX56_14505 [Synechococcus moorigangaii CMS01]|nr:hypothetical protein [Synechococcus moorigangaii CMS01]
MKKMLLVALGSSSIILAQQVKANPVFIDFDYQYQYGYQYNYDYDDYNYYYHANAYTYRDDSVGFPVEVIISSACQQPQLPMISNIKTQKLSHENVLIAESNIIIDNSFNTDCSELEENRNISWDDSDEMSVFSDF